jgi:hypothetical protein
MCNDAHHWQYRVVKYMIHIQKVPSRNNPSQGAASFLLPVLELHHHHWSQLKSVGTGAASFCHGAGSRAASKWCGYATLLYRPFLTFRASISLHRFSYVLFNSVVQILQLFNAIDNQPKMSNAMWKTFPLHHICLALARTLTFLVGLQRWNGLELVD